MLPILIHMGCGEIEFWGRPYVGEGIQNVNISLNFSAQKVIYILKYAALTFELGSLHFKFPFFDLIFLRNLKVKVTQL